MIKMSITATAKMAMATTMNAKAPLSRTLLVLSVLAHLFCGLEVASAADAVEGDYSGWYTSTGESFDGSSTTSFPPPGFAGSPGLSPGTELKKCMFGGSMIVVEEKQIILLTETLLVDGCLLDCGKKMLQSTVKDGPIVAVRNGGHVRNCEVAIIKLKDMVGDLQEIDAIEGIVTDNSAQVNSINVDVDVVANKDAGEEATSPPTIWGSFYATSFFSAYGTYYEQRKIFENTSTAGFLCDKGDCLLENVSCGAYPAGDDVHLLLMRECVLVRPGAATVSIKGGNSDDPSTGKSLVTSVDQRAVSAYGIVVDAGPNPEKEAAEGSGFKFYTPADYEDLTKARLLVDNVRIEYQVYDGIKIIGGVNTVRVTNSVLSKNGGDGIEVTGGDGLEMFAVLGGALEDNEKNGIDVIQVDIGVSSPSKTKMLLSDVLVRNNSKDGILVYSIGELTIDGAMIEKNAQSGISIREVSVINLQGVVSKFNILNGLSVEAEGSDVVVANCVFLTNGYDITNIHGPSPKWKKAGVYMWLSKSATISNSASIGNSMDGIILYDVESVFLSGVDASRNGDDGIQIREADASYGYDYTANTDYLVGAYYYPWHGDDFHNGGGYLRKELKPPQQPSLGEYNDSDPEVIKQHMEWFRKSNIGLLVTSWWGPDRIEDTNTRDVLMEHSSIGNLKIALHYETTGRIKEGDESMSVPQSDIQYMCDNYFDHPNYYKIDGRPVLVIYISRKLEQLGTLEKALLTMKSAASKCGHNLYLIGDAVFAKAPDADEPFVSFLYFDAVTNYDVYGSSGASKRENPYAGKEAVDAYYAEQEKWRKLALEQNCRYIPPVSPGYNDRAVRFEKDNPPLSRRLNEASEEGSLFMYQLQKALPLVDPAIDNMILVNSFNEWHEDTQIEPARGVNFDEDAPVGMDNVASEPMSLTHGLEYVGYGEKYLDILRSMTDRPKDDDDAANGVYEPSYVEIKDVHACNNGKHGITFFIIDNNSNGKTSELIFTPGEGILSCENHDFDIKLHGGGDIDILVSSSSEEKTVVGNSCANGAGSLQNFNCFGMDLERCQPGSCRYRDIITRSGAKLDDHNID